jgi:hypothetical protein
VGGPPPSAANNAAGFAARERSAGHGQSVGFNGSDIRRRRWRSSSSTSRTVGIHYFVGGNGFQTANGRQSGSAGDRRLEWPETSSPPRPSAGSRFYDLTAALVRGAHHAIERATATAERSRPWRSRIDPAPVLDGGDTGLTTRKTDLERCVRRLHDHTGLVSFPVSVPRSTIADNASTDRTLEMRPRHWPGNCATSRAIHLAEKGREAGAAQSRGTEFASGRPGLHGRPTVHRHLAERGCRWSRRSSPATPTSPSAAGFGAGIGGSFAD